MSEQQTLFANTTAPTFGGKTFEAVHDQARLVGQFERVFSLMKDGRARTLTEIQSALHVRYPGTHDTQPGISARLRDCRKVRFGSHTVIRERRGDPKKGLFTYRLILKS